MRMRRRALVSDANDQMDTRAMCPIIDLSFLRLIRTFYDPAFAKPGIYRAANRTKPNLIGCYHIACMMHICFVSGV